MSSWAMCGQTYGSSLPIYAGYTTRSVRSESDAVIILFNSDETDSFENGIDLWKTIRDRVNVHSTPELWVVDRGKAGMDTELCHPDRHFVVDSMTSEGFLDLSYDIRTALLRK